MQSHQQMHIQMVVKQLSQLHTRHMQIVQKQMQSHQQMHIQMVVKQQSQLHTKVMQIKQK
ncbi:MAG: hypothetical protein EBS68_13125 [Rhodobacteraceae bacterium]|nr:hypothetical protein [Paracoccaceae bacterium]